MKNLLRKWLALFGKKTSHPMPLHQAMQLAQAHFQNGRFDLAAQLYRQILAHDPANLAVINNLGAACGRLNQLDEAEMLVHEALKLKPDYAEAHNNLGIIWRNRGLLDKAEACFRKAVEIRPDYVEALTNLGNVLQELGHPLAALEQSNKACELAPENAALHWNLSLLFLLLGDYENGFRLYEKRLECTAPPFTGGSALYAKLAPYPRWQGEGLSGRRLLIWAEQGLGDSIMMMRYIPLLTECGVGEVFIFCEPALVRLAQNIPGISQVFPTSQSLSFELFDLHCPMMSLPHLFRTRLNSIPDKVPYLSVPQGFKDKWRERLSGFRGVKVGLVWAGSAMLRDDAKRSIPLCLFKPLLGQASVRLISLQKGVGAKQLADLGWDIADWMDECDDFMDTAALVENLDLVLAVDTAVAHLAGALGKPVWLLNRFGSEWRWGLGREDSLWYPSMRIFRQREPDDWGEVIPRIVEELGKFALLAGRDLPCDLHYV